MPRRPSRSLRRRSRFRQIFRLRNSMDFTRLEPGDIVLVANPTDPLWIQAFLFWSHLAIYVGGPDEDRAFVDAVNLPVPGAGRRSDGALPWQRVRFTRLRAFQSYCDVLALRPPLSAEARRAAAEFAKSQVGRPFARRPALAILRPHRRLAARDLASSAASDSAATPPAEFTCASLVWEAYRRQGFDLSRGPGRLLAPWPSGLGHDRRLVPVGRGTRYRHLVPGRGQLALYLARFWARWGLRSDIIWRGLPDPDPPSG